MPYRFLSIAAAAAAMLIATPQARAADGGGDDSDAMPVMAHAAAATLAPGRHIWQDSATNGPVTVVVSTADQRAYVYRGTTLVAASAVSTGKEGNETPIGAFTILQKNRDHRSNLYDDAPMPYMQRLTWDGIAIHAGRNPGFPASHGCIRVPTAFAAKLFEATRMGGAVLVTDMPVDETTDPDSVLAMLPPSEAELTAIAQ